MFQNDTLPVGRRYLSPSQTTLSNLAPELLCKIKAEAMPMLEKPLSLPSQHPLAAVTNRKPEAIVYRNSAECRPYHHALHTFEGLRFGNDFTCESIDFEHWFNAESYFCAAAFADGEGSQARILSLVEMLFVTEASAQAFISGTIPEQDLVPYDKNKDSVPPPVIYFSSMISQNSQDSVRLLRSVIKDIHIFMEKYRVAPNWGFSVVISNKAKDYLINSGFYKIKSQSFLNKYDMVKIDAHSARSKIWSSILSENPAIPMTNRRKMFMRPSLASQALPLGLANA